MFNFQVLSKMVQQARRSLYARIDDQLIDSVNSVAGLITREMAKMEKKGFLDSGKYREAQEVLDKLGNIKKEILELKKSLEEKPWAKEEIDFKDA